MTLRFGILLFVFLIVLFLVIQSLVKGGYGGRFRTVTLSLLVILMLLMFTGIFYTKTHYTVDTVQSEFAADRSEILHSMKSLMQRGEHEKAWQLGSRYAAVQDKELEQLIRDSREQMLLSQIEAAGNNTVQVVELYRELTSLKPLPKYESRLEELQARQQEEEIREILGVIETLPDERAGLRMLGFRLLYRMVPENKGFRLEMERHEQLLQDRLKESGWISICSSSDITYCQFVGYDALRQGGAGSASNDDERLGEILGVVWRPRGTSIGNASKEAPEDGYYYVVYKDGGTFLRPCEKVTVRGFPIAQRSEPVRKARGNVSSR